MAKKVVLLVNDIPGLKVTKYLRSRGDIITRLYLHSPAYRKMGKEIITAAGVKKSQIFLDTDLKNPDHIAELKKMDVEFIISVFWRLLLTKNVLSVARRGTVNFHPALLPQGRGWYPHVFSFINGIPTGVTLHAMDDNADTGPIWAQKKVPIQPYDTAKEIYQRLQNEIVQLFIETWPKISSGKIKPKSQSSKNAIYYAKKSIEELDAIDLNKKMPVKDIINLLRARSFGDLGFAYYKDKGNVVYLNLRLNDTSNFGKKK